GAFKQQAHFVELHRSGQLTPPQTAAADIIAYLQSDDFGSEPVVDIRTIHH
ncbi:MAG: short-chain dehydrogenase, partial [Anaerolineales bacterium]|nr:short-chain dehydrogenase [Anaerolineales bacterium]